ncbi:MAG: hypothetical protein IT488_13685 [Gammaproteobacteria bacterium]|nr:hypothetical protein [Gammaproteobacteria bacterium]
MSDVQNSSRRDFLKKSAYVVPVIMTLQAAPTLAGQGSGHVEHHKRKRKEHKRKSHKRGH